MATSLTRYDTHAGYYAALITEGTPPEAAFVREFYRLLYSYYQQNGLYNYINEQLSTTRFSDATVKPLRNPAWRVVEFYASKLWPGTLPDALTIVTENQRIIEPIHQVWTWSNLSAKKQRWARWFAIYGDLFIKVNTKAVEGRPSAVYLSLIKPEYVTDFELDERGFLTWIRIDVTGIDDDDAERTHTEIWSKELQEMSVWRHGKGPNVDIDQLGTPIESFTFQQLHGEDFIPIVYQQFRDDGAGRGSGAFSAQLDKIDETNRQATRLAQILFRYNKALWVATNSGMDSSGRPLPPAGFGDEEPLLMADDEIMSLPSMVDLKPLTPNINYADALAILEAQMQELERDLPELAYYSLREMGELSGRAVRFLLDDTISRVIEARGNAETALIRAEQMALTVGQNLGLFNNLGDYVSGDFNHAFVERPVLPTDPIQEAELIETLTRSGASLFAAGKRAGLTDEEANDLAQVDLFGAEEFQR